MREYVNHAMGPKDNGASAQRKGHVQSDSRLRSKEEGRAGRGKQQASSGPREPPGWKCPAGTGLAPPSRLRAASVLGAVWVWSIQTSGLHPSSIFLRRQRKASERVLSQHLAMERLHITLTGDRQLHRSEANPTTCYLPTVQTRSKARQALNSRPAKQPAAYVLPFCCLVSTHARK